MRKNQDPEWDGTESANRVNPDSLRHAYGLGPALPRYPAAPFNASLWAKLQAAKEAYRVVSISFANQEASEAQLMAAARNLRSLQEAYR